MLTRKMIRFFLSFTFFRDFFILIISLFHQVQYPFANFIFSPSFKYHHILKVDKSFHLYPLFFFGNGSITILLLYSMVKRAVLDNEKFILIEKVHITMTHLRQIIKNYKIQIQAGLLNINMVFFTKLSLLKIQ